MIHRITSEETVIPQKHQTIIWECVLKLHDDFGLMWDLGEEIHKTDSSSETTALVLSF